jgi:hypothetical protein
MSRTHLPVRATVAAGLAVGCAALGTLAGPAFAEPAPQACYGQFIVPFVHSYGGARNASETFFGDAPHAVQTGHEFVVGVCGTGGGSG